MPHRAAFGAAIVADDVGAVEGLLRLDPQLAHEPMDASGCSPLHLAARHDAGRVAAALLEGGADFYARDANGQLALDVPPGQRMNETRKRLRERNRTCNAFLAVVHEQKLDRVKELLAADETLAAARDIGDGWTAVMTACHFGNVELLRVLVAAGAPLDGADFHSGHDAVYVCADKGAAGCLRVLIEAGADVTRTWRVAYGALPMEMNALHVAAWKGHSDVLAVLLEAKVDPNARARSYAVFSPLHFAAIEGHAEVVRQLIDAGADTAALDGRRGITALEMAEAGKHEAVAAILRGG
jgi:ankyrin repeat protein